MEHHHRRHHSSGEKSQKVYLPHVRSVPTSRKRPRPQDPPPKPADDDMFTVTPENFQLAKKKLQLEKEGQVSGAGIAVPVIPGSANRRSTGSIPLSSENHRIAPLGRPPLTLRNITNDKVQTPTPVRRSSDLSLSSSASSATVDLSGGTGEEIDADTQRLLKFFGCTLIRRASTLLKAPQNTAATAQVYFHRFYAFHSMKLFDVALIARCCLYLACKAEESLRKARDVLNTVSYVLNPSAPALKIGKVYWDLRDEMVAAEQVLLRVLAFNLSIEHPYRYLLNYIYSLRGSEALAHVAWSLINDIFFHARLIECSPSLIACGAIHLASQMLDEKILPNAPTNKDWWEIFGCRKEDVEEMSLAILGAIEELQGIPFQAAMAIHKGYLATYAPPSVLSIVKPAMAEPVKKKPITS